MVESKHAGEREQGPLLTLLGIALLSGASMGFFSPLLSQLALSRGYSELVLGIVAAAYYLFVAVGSVWASQLCRRYGIRRSLILGLVVGAIAAALSPSAPNAVWLAIARAAAGLGAGLYMTAMSAALASRANDTNRARLMGLSALAFGIGLGLGPLAAPPLFERSALLAFGSGGALLLVGAVFVQLWIREVRVQPSTASLAMVRRLAVPIQAVFAYGFAEASLLSMYPSFLLGQGMSPKQMGLACSAFVLGSLAATLPVTMLADRLGRARVLLGCTVIGSAVTATLAHGGGFQARLLLSCAVGASVGPIYALAYAIVGDRVLADEIPAAAAAVTGAFALGCIVGPVLTALVMQSYGSSLLFVPTLVLLAALTLKLSLADRQAQQQEQES